MSLLSPVSGRPLRADTPHSLSDDAGERWPIVDGIPYLRADAEGLVAVALDHLDADCPDDALVALLTDQDEWWTGPATNLREVKRLVRERDALTLREAMALLKLGPVAEYFAYRWSDPTYLAGLALLEAHWVEPRTAFELSSGIGHYMRELTARGVQCVGADVVFAKCWLAKNWVAPRADYLVFDAAHPWPVEGRSFDLVACMDAFYFLPDQPDAARRLRAAVAPGGVLAVAHVHNGAFVGPVRGPARAPAEWAAMFPGATVYDEAELLGALLEARAPRATAWTAPSDTAEAFALVEGAQGVRAVTSGLALPRPDAPLRPNPLLVDGSVCWPSPHYEREYGAGCFWARADADLGAACPDPARLRRLVDLPDRW